MHTAHRNAVAGNERGTSRTEHLPGDLVTLVVCL